MITEKDILKYRKQYGLREATPEEMTRMTDEQRWHYHASAHKSHNVHFENFRHEGRSVRPLYLHLNGKIYFGCESGNQVGLRPMPVRFNRQTIYYHYTIGLKLQSIADEGVIRTSPLKPKWPEKPVAWLSINPVYENSALKVAMTRTGKTKVMTLNDMAQVGQGIFRFLFTEDSICQKIFPWRILRSKSKMPKKLISKLVRRAAEVKANPADWHGCMEPILLDGHNLELFQNGYWEPVEIEEAIGGLGQGGRILQMTADQMNLDLQRGQFIPGQVLHP